MTALEFGTGVELFEQLSTLHKQRASAVLTSGEQAVLELKDGDLVHARYARVKGVPALFALALNPVGRFEVSAAHPALATNIKSPTKEVLLQLHRMLCEFEEDVTAERVQKERAERRRSARVLELGEPGTPASRSTSPEAVVQTPKQVEAKIPPPPPAAVAPPSRSERAADRAKSPTLKARRKPASASDSRPGLNALPKLGELVGRCLITESIARGGTCQVFRGVHQSLQIGVAIKVLIRNGDADGDWEECTREARILARLNHPNIVRILDFDDQGTHPYLVLEFVDGLSLRELIVNSGALQPHRAVRLARDTAAALDYALKHGVIHRDLKPANILVGRDGIPRLADLGISTLIGETASPGHIAGTPGYIAPELIRGEPSDHRADIYSLGVTLFEMLTGQSPYTANDTEGLLRETLSTPPPAPHELMPNLDLDLSQVVLQLLTKEPSERPQSYEELIDLLQPHITPHTTGLERRRTSSGFWGSVVSLFRKETP